MDKYPFVTNAVYPLCVVAAQLPAESVDHTGCALPTQRVIFDNAMSHERGLAALGAILEARAVNSGDVRVLPVWAASRAFSSPELPSSARRFQLDVGV